MSTCYCKGQKWLPLNIERQPGLNPDTPIWFGKYRGTPLGEVPSSYLRWLYSKMYDKKKPLFKYLDTIFGEETHKK